MSAQATCAGARGSSAPECCGRTAVGSASCSPSSQSPSRSSAPSSRRTARPQRSGFPARPRVTATRSGSISSAATCCRALYGGRSTLLLAGLATVLTYAVGGAIGLIAGISRSKLDSFLMRGVDILLSVPALLVILLLVTAFGIKASVLVVATSLVLLPGVARIVRSATLEVSTRGYVESAIARGEPTRALLLREVLPNISGIVTADLGLRFSWSIILIASVNFLGIGIQPPTPDWGVMISENRVVLGSNPMAVIAPSVMLGVLIVGVNLIGDAYVRQLDRSQGE